MADITQAVLERLQPAIARFREALATEGVEFNDATANAFGDFVVAAVSAGAREASEQTAADIEDVLRQGGLDVRLVMHFHEPT